MDPTTAHALEEAVQALGLHEPGAARAALEVAVTGAEPIGPVADAVVAAAAELEAHGEISPGSWNALADAVPEDLRRIVEASRG